MDKKNKERTTPPPASQERGGDLLCKLAAAMREVTRFAPSMVYRGSRMEKAWDDAREALADFDNYVASPPSSAAEGNGTSASQDDFHGDGRDNKRQPRGTTSGSSPGYSRPSPRADNFELDEGDRMTLRCALVSFSEELKRDGLGTDDHGVRMTAAYLARISRLLTRINNSAAECKTCNGLGIVGGVMGQTPESMEQVTENCPDCGDDVTAGGTSTGDEDLPGMWTPSDFTGGATDAAEQAKPDDCPFCGREGKHYGEEVCPGLNKPSTFTLAEQAQAVELPPLPDPAGFLGGKMGPDATGKIRRDVYTADQMREYANASRLAGGVTVTECNRDCDCVGECKAGLEKRK